MKCRDSGPLPIPGPGTGARGADCKLGWAGPAAPPAAIPCLSYQSSISLLISTSNSAKVLLCSNNILHVPLPIWLPCWILRVFMYTIYSLARVLISASSTPSRKSGEGFGCLNILSFNAFINLSKILLCKSQRTRLSPGPGLAVLSLSSFEQIKHRLCLLFFSILLSCIVFLRGCRNTKRD